MPAAPPDPRSDPNVLGVRHDRRLLIVDGHGSHTTVEFVSSCIEFDIDLLILPAHTSHVTQPLDVGIFGPLKAALAASADRASFWVQGTIPKSVWVASLAAARSIAMTSRNVRVGWRKTGLVPYDPSQVKLPTRAPLQATPTSSTTSQLSTASLMEENDRLLEENKDSLDQGILEHLKSLATTAEAVNALNATLEMENRELRAVLAIKKRKREGITQENLGGSEFTRADRFGRICEYNELRKLKRARKGKGKARADSYEGEEQDDA